MAEDYINTTISTAKGNISSEQGSMSRNEFLARFEMATLSVILFFALFGNSVVIIVLKCCQQKLSRMQLFIIHLSIADIFVGLMQVLPQLIWKITEHFIGNNFLCKTIKYLQIVTMYASSYVLVMTAIDRYVSICYPLTSQTWTSKRVHVMITIAWTLSILFALPQLQIFSYEKGNTGVYDCLDNFYGDDGNLRMQIYITWTFLAVYLIPLLILAYLYSRICYVVWISVNSREDTTKRNAKSRRLGDKDSFSTENGSFTKIPRAHSRGLSKSKIKTIKLTLTVVLCFLICWAPFFFLMMISSFDLSINYYTSSVTAIVTLLSALNSCTNPWIYLAFSGRFCSSRKRASSKTSFTVNSYVDTETRLRACTEQMALAMKPIKEDDGRILTDSRVDET
ncbi:hypothetical protein CHS0354_036989 [Potamilus streckersoni]|uniref:G-protein coupled receptors family 1 profile domain-containing protein n=1 Tax=Potamilus streckersoni TaxID=2493646 RepID=A0AAE0SK42_9BIVA|nr:hypothetical protein CHS0354_036989 [Potamilus streckersoni]